MTELSEHAHTLLAAVADAHEPTPADLERLERRLAPLGSPPPAIAPALAATTVVAAAAVLAAWVAGATSPAPAPEPPPAARAYVPARQLRYAPITPEPTTSEGKVASSERVEQVARAVRASPIVRAPPVASTLAEEVALLSAVRRALAADRAAEALERLDEYDGRFGAGVLSVEASLARLDALCLAGRRAEHDAVRARHAEQFGAEPLPRPACSAAGAETR